MIAIKFTNAASITKSDDLNCLFLSDLSGLLLKFLDYKIEVDSYSDNGVIGKIDVGGMVYQLTAIGEHTASSPKVEVSPHFPTGVSNFLGDRSELIYWAYRSLTEDVDFFYSANKENEKVHYSYNLYADYLKKIDSSFRPILKINHNYFSFGEKGIGCYLGQERRQWIFKF